MRRSRAYLSEAGLFEHVAHVRDARDTLFRDFADDHRMTMYGTPSQRFLDLAQAHGAAVRCFSLLQGLESGPEAPPTTAQAGDA